MAKSNGITFYLNIGWLRWWLLIFPVALIFILLGLHYSIAIVVTIQMTIFLVLVVALGTVAVHRNGIVLYRINRLEWSNISTVKRRSFLGLPYLHITRCKGIGGWWLPLYLNNETGFYAAVVLNAPSGNALRSYAEAAIAR